MGGKKFSFNANHLAKDMNTKKVLYIFFILSLLNIQSIDSYCPPYEQLRPCYCHSRVDTSRKCNTSSNSLTECQHSIITCAGDQPFSLSEVFSRVKNSTTDENDTYFEWFYLSNTAITKLEANTLGGLNFRNIYIRQCLNLRTINPLAFNNSSNFVQNIWINATKLSDRMTDKRNVFKALNSLNQLKTLEVIGSEFTSIPAKAFNRYSSLKTISFNNYNERQFVAKINSNSFYRLNDLRKIDFRNNRISKVNSFAFRFHTKSNHTLRIHLENNYLNSNSFKPNAFSGGNGRRVILYLGGFNECNTQIKTLNKDVFEPFLLENKRNVIEMYGCPIICDHRVLWINGKKDFLTKRIRNLKCSPDLVLTNVMTKNNFIKQLNKTNEILNQLSVRRLKTRSKNHSKNRRKKFKLKSNSTKNSKPKMTLKLRLGIE